MEEIEEREPRETITIFGGDIEVIGVIILILGIILLISSFFPLEWQFYWPTLILGIALVIIGAFLFRRVKHKRKCISSEDMEEFCEYVKEFGEEVCQPRRKRRTKFRYV